MQDLDHLHLVCRATVARPPRDVETMNQWIRDVVEAVGMKFLVEPHSVRCDTVGNEGVTGAAVIETSHFAAHCWETAPTPFINFDLYSCKRFDPEVVLETLARFKPFQVCVMFIDRNEEFKVLLNETRRVSTIVDLMEPDMKIAYNARRLIPPPPTTPEMRAAKQEYSRLMRMFSYKHKKTHAKNMQDHSYTLKVIRSRSKKKGLPYDLDSAWYSAAIAEAKVKWPKLTIHGVGISFWSACVDRIDPCLGYVKSNCRILPHALNVAKWKWTPAEFADLAALVEDEAKNI